jgi:hypothetical protein
MRFRNIFTKFARFVIEKVASACGQECRGSGKRWAAKRLRSLRVVSGQKEQAIIVDDSDARAVKPTRPAQEIPVEA